MKPAGGVLQIAPSRGNEHDCSCSRQCPRPRLLGGLPHTLWKARTGRLPFSLPISDQPARKVRVQPATGVLQAAPSSGNERTMGDDPSMGYHHRAARGVALVKYLGAGVITYLALVTE